MKEVVMIIVIMLSLLSAVLTVLRLLQIKEWRWDRLKEHLSQEGYCQQLFGVLRPTLFIVWMLASTVVVAIASDPTYITQTLSAVLLVLFAGISLFRIVTNRQPLPVWTMKAKAVMALTGILTVLLLVTCVLFWPLYGEMSASIISFLSPLLTIAAWMLLQPVDSTLKKRILSQAIALRNSHPRLRVVGITGSVGKTTTKEILAHILKSNNAIATPEHINSEMGVAQWMIQILTSMDVHSDTILIVEMGAYRKGEIATLCRIAQPTYGIITYVGNQHLSLFGSREAILQAKGELFEALPTNGHAFGNSDNDAYEALKEKCRCTVVSVGTGQHADIQATDLEETAQGIQFRALDTVFHVPIAGTHTVTGILLAIAVAQEFRMSPRDIARRLTTFRPLKNTFEVKKIGSTTILDDTYNSSPASVKAAIEWAHRQPQKVKTFVMEGIIELGKEEEKIHSDIAKDASKVFNVAYVAHPRHLAYFRDNGFESRVHLVTDSSHVPEGSLLVLSGRLSPQIIKRFLP